MSKAFARDVICMISAVSALTALASAIWFTLVLWVLPPTAVRPVSTYLPFAAPIAVAVLGVGVLLYVPLRGRARWGKPIGAPSWRDLFVAPLLAGAVLGLGFLLIALLVGEKEDAALAAVGGLGLAIPLALAAWCVVLVQRVTSRPTFSLGVAAATLAVLSLGGCVALDLRGRRAFASYKAVAMAEIAAERQRIAADRRPVLFGAPIDENAAERYRTLSQAIADKLQKPKAASALASAVEAGPGIRPSADVVRWGEELRPELLSLREAVRCTRCDWSFAWEESLTAPVPSLMGARHAADPLVIESYQHAAAGDVQGAVERQLEVIRMGADYESSHGLIGTLIAIALEGIGTDALLRLVATDGLPAAPAWDQVLAKLDLLEPRLASMSIGYRRERLSYVGWHSRLKLGLPGPPRPVDIIVPVRFFVADLVRTADQTLREAEKASEMADPRVAARLTQVAFDNALRSRNFLVHIELPSLARARVAQEQKLTRFRILRAAILLEKAWAQDGRYPESVVALDLPIDPFAHPTRLRYEATADGRGYKLWSVGINGTDEGGVAKERADEVFERPVRAASAPRERDRLR